MSRSQRHSFELTLRRASCLAPALVFVIISLAACPAHSQSNPANSQANSARLTFHSGQSMYIVAFCVNVYYLNEAPIDGKREYINYDLAAERKVRKRIEEWNYFKVAEKPSEADFVFLVHLDDSSIEGLAVPIEAYRQHLKENFDLDALREAAFGRYLIGPLKLPTVTRLSDRLVKQFREKLTKVSP